MRDPLKVRPDLVFAVFCGRRPYEGGNGMTLSNVINEVVADKLPYERSIWLVVGWQRGIGSFDYRYLIRSEDGEVIAQDGPYRIEMFPQGTQSQELRISFVFESYGTYLCEGYLDGEPSFTTMLRVSTRG